VLVVGALVVAFLWAKVLFNSMGFESNGKMFPLPSKPIKFLPALASAVETKFRGAGSS
jgi:hypothetical protein